MDRLPPELLYRILDFCTPELYDSHASNGPQVRPSPAEDLHGMPGAWLSRISEHRRPWRNDIPFTDDPREMPWVLTHVCQAWRNYVLSKPIMWSFISTRFASEAPPSQVHFYRGRVGMEAFNAHQKDRSAEIKASNERLRQQLRRSLNQPLTVVFRPPDGMASLIDRSFYILCGHVSRWRDLRIKLYSHRARDFSALRGLLPSLESLDITFLEPGVEREIAAFEIAPRLTKLVLSGNHCLGNGTALRLPFLQITDFCWYDDQHPSILLWRGPHEILARVRNVERCRILLHSLSIEAYRNKVEFVTLPKLQELELIDNRGLSGIDVMFSWIRAPSLTKLTISSSGRTPLPLLHFLSFADSLHSLTIHNVDMSPHEFGVFLSELTALKALSFGVGGGITDDYLGLFREKESEAGIDEFLAVPGLQKLTLLEVKDIASSYNEGPLLDVLEARWRNPDIHARLRCIDLARNVVTEEARTRLSQLRAEGLRVYLPPVEN
ncbi:hypothetical protein V5O48_009517 [Marasmius crinis-equi]|uniref:F-box domain-containing protein n=1 Tax=Marasmius crinis-equi TaxID=585013 RepID=A0ABR3FBG2_9AGAR